MEESWPFPPRTSKVILHRDMPVQAWHGGEGSGAASRLRTLSYREARAFYDRLGRGQNWQRFYEDSAVAELIRHLQLSEARAVFEFGCGTGRLAEKLLREHLPETTRYEAVDISTTMVQLTKQRLAPFQDRARVRSTYGRPALSAPNGTFDRFISTYVLDLLSNDDICALLTEAARLLGANGLLGLVSLTHGCTTPSRLVERIWTALHRLRPSLVGGCRPITLKAFISPDSWRTEHHVTVTRCGISSEVIVAAKLD